MFDFPFPIARPLIYLIWRNLVQPLNYGWIKTIHKAEKFHEIRVLELKKLLRASEITPKWGVLAFFLRFRTI